METQRPAGQCLFSIWGMFRPLRWVKTDIRWVRSWILFRLAIIAQGISARAALGQASSANARADNVQFNFFGKMAWEAKLDAEKEQGTRAKL